MVSKKTNLKLFNDEPNNYEDLFHEILHFKYDIPIKGSSMVKKLSRPMLTIQENQTDDTQQNIDVKLPKPQKQKKKPKKQSENKENIDEQVGRPKRLIKIPKRYK